MKHLKPYNELFNIFKKKKDIDINALPDKEVLTDILESELPDDVEFDIQLVYFKYDKNGNPTKFISGDIRLSVIFANFRDMNINTTINPNCRKGYQVNFYNRPEGYSNQFAIGEVGNRMLIDVSVKDINIDKFKAYGIKCVQDRKSSILCYT